MKGKDLLPWIIGIICGGVVIGILRGSGIILGGLPTALITIGCITVVGVVIKSIKKSNSGTENKSPDEQSARYGNEDKKDIAEKTDDEN